MRGFGRFRNGFLVGGGDIVWWLACTRYLPESITTTMALTAN